MQTPGKTKLVTLGIFVGIIIFGAQVVVVNYNQAVAPVKSLALMDWQVREDKLQVNLLGDTLQVPLDEKWYREAWQTSRTKIEDQLEQIGQRLKMMQQVVYELKVWP